MELTSWAIGAVGQIRKELRDDDRWRDALSSSHLNLHRVHLAVFVEPFLSYVLSGVKSIESRFSTKQCAPFRRVAAGDIILLKAASGPVKGICSVAKTWFFDLRSTPLGRLRERFAESICATEDAFWVARRNAEYATLIEIESVRTLSEFSCPKRDRRGWVVLRGDSGQATLPTFA